jgi:6-phosphogluconolactonase
VFTKASLAISILAILGLAACVFSGGRGQQTAYVVTPFTASVAAYHVDNNTGAFSQILGSPYGAGISPSSILLHPSGKFVYVANAGENDISLFKVATSGALTEVTPRTPTGMNPTSMVMDSAGSFLFVANGNSNTIRGYSISGSTGALTALSGAPAQTGFSPVNLAMTASGKFLYVANSNSASVSGFAVDSSGGLTAVPGPPSVVGAGPNRIAIDPSGKFLYVASLAGGNFSGFTIDSTSGALSAMNGSPFGVTVSTTITPLSSLVVDRSGKYLYVTNQSGNNVYAFTIDASSGVPKAITATPVPPYAAGTSPVFIVNDATGKLLFVGNQNSTSISVFSITPSTGVLTAVSTSTTGSAPVAMAVVK